MHMQNRLQGIIQFCGDLPMPKEELDLVQMAKAAMHYLIENPRPELDYECRFGIDLMREKIWPEDNEHEVITIGDTDLRMLIEYEYMKEITGSKEAEVAAAGVWKRGMSYLDAQYGCTVVSECWNGADQSYTAPWATGKLLIALCDRYRRQKDESFRVLCRNMYKSLCQHSVKDGDALCYPNGNGVYHTNGTAAISNETQYSPAMQPEAIAVYAETFEDAEALEFAHALAKGEMQGLMAKHWILNDFTKLDAQQTDELGRIADSQTIYTLPDRADALVLVQEDGSFAHHSHMRGHNVWGIAHIAYLTKDKELIAWCKRVLDFYLSRGTDYGWIPESMTYPRRSETCAVADVINIALYMAKCGYTEYYDTVERFIRNYIYKAQFFVTDEYRSLYLSRHPGKAGIRGLKEAKRIEGGFLGAVGINDRLYDDTHMDMMGCCAPEGMRSIYYAWKHVVQQEEDGVVVHLNFTVDRPEAEIISLLPETGGMEILAKTSGRYRIRCAPWAERDSICVLHNENPVKVWVSEDGYVMVPDVKSGDRILVSYPVKSFCQIMTVKNEDSKPDRELKVYWRGSDVVDVLPRGPHLPFYQQDEVSY